MGIGNLGNMMKVMNAWNTFKQNHPKFPAFCSAVSKCGIREGSILEVTLSLIHISEPTRLRRKSRMPSSA